MIVILILTEEMNVINAAMVAVYLRARPRKDMAVMQEIMLKEENTVRKIMTTMMIGMMTDV
jgi:type IV secretory pathway TraG/TraD family ATPase VirD4